MSKPVNSNKDCLFCNLENERILYSNEHAFATRDKYPVTEHHTLIIPKRHTASYFELTEREILSCHEFLIRSKNDILELDPSVTGLNIGINIGESAGQTIFHCHMHLIPRRKHDVENPRGGVRGVIQEKQQY
jgi:ATP adenylyltransferase